MRHLSFFFLLVIVSCAEEQAVVPIEEDFSTRYGLYEGGEHGGVTECGTKTVCVFAIADTNLVTMELASGIAIDADEKYGDPGEYTRVFVYSPEALPGKSRERHCLDLTRGQQPHPCDFRK